MTAVAPLRYQTNEPLDIPAAAFNDGLAVLIINGGSYGGEWHLSIFPTHIPLAERERIGEVLTGPAPRQPDRAVEAASAWLAGECARLGYDLLRVDSQNHQYGPGEAPFFALALAVVARPAADVTP
jgi:hypothetical protein